MARGRSLKDAACSVRAKDELALGCGWRDDRRELAALLDCARAGDALVLWRLDRLGRSVQHLVALLADLERRGIEFRSLTEALDTTTPGGRLVFHVFAAVAESSTSPARVREPAWKQPGAAGGAVAGPLS